MACGTQGQTRPGQYALPCAGAGPNLTGLRWASWGPSAAFAAGSYNLDDCVPTRVGGKLYQLPATVTYPLSPDGGA